MILLFTEFKFNYRWISGHEVHPECIVELKEVRRSLMEDYQINPLLVRDCSTEIQFHCGGGLHRDGKTIHCLMDLARPKKKFDGKHSPMSPTCVRAVRWNLFWYFLLILFSNCFILCEFNQCKWMQMLKQNKELVFNNNKIWWCIASVWIQFSFPPPWEPLHLC